MIWKGPEATFFLVALLAWGPALPCPGDSYLNRSKLREAVPYGTTIEPPTSHEGPKAAGEPDGDGPHDTGPPSGITPSTVDPEPTQGGRGGGTYQPR